MVATTLDRRRAPPKPPAQTRGGFRADVQALRALAVLLVVLYHAGVPGLTGGFVGVDVFFVISGFLITGLLVREQTAPARSRSSSFYARRMRRLTAGGRGGAGRDGRGLVPVDAATSAAPHIAQDAL